MTSAPQWEVYVLEYARAKDQPVASLINGTHDQVLMDTPFSFVFARSGGRNVLIDSGFMREGIGAEMSERFGVPDPSGPPTPERVAALAAECIRHGIELIGPPLH